MSVHPSTKNHVPWVYQGIRAGQRYHFRTKNPWVHNALNLGCMLALCAAVVLVVRASGLLPAYAYIPVAAVVLGLLYFGLFILVVHEASHGMFVLSAHRPFERAANRALGWAVAVFFAVHYTKHWERGHLEHHVRPLLPTDPQRFNALVGPPLFKKVLLTLFVPGFLLVDRTVGRTKLQGGKSASSKGVLVAFVGVWAAALGTAGFFYGPAAPVALFLGIHTITAWNLVKGSLEHGGTIGEEPDLVFRSRTTLFPGRQLLMPFNITLHFEHHLNFCVPWYDLLRYQRDLREIVPAPVWRDVVNRSPWRQLRGGLGGLGPDARALTVRPAGQVDDAAHAGLEAAPTVAA